MNEFSHLDLAPPLETPQDFATHQAALVGFPVEQARLAENLKVLTYYNLEGAQFIQRNEGDRDEIPLEATGLTRRAVDVLTSRLYNPPPSRQILDDPEADAFLNSVLRDNVANQLWAEADRLTTLLGFAAIEAVPSNSPLKPVRLYLWGADQLILLPDADDATSVGGIVTIDKFEGNKIRYSWWSKDAKRVYVSKKAWNPSETSGGRATAYRPDLSHVNPYGRLPFGLIHHALPTAGVSTLGIGDYLAQSDAAIDAKRYHISLGVDKYTLPKPFVSGVAADWQPSDVVGEYVRIPAATLGAGGETSKPEVGYFQPLLDVEQAEFHIDKSISRTLETVGVPESLYRMSQSSVLSGEALEAEQRPLLDYTEKRQELFKNWETDTAEAILSVGGYLARSQVLVEASRGSNLSVTWPSSEHRDPADDREALELGIESLVSVTKRRLRLTSDEEALQRLVQVKEDNAKLRALGILPPLAEDATPSSPAPEQGEPEVPATPEVSAVQVVSE